LTATPGATPGDIDNETKEHGVNSTTMISRLTLGGGCGWQETHCCLMLPLLIHLLNDVALMSSSHRLTRKHGMTCDNLIGADVVTAKKTQVCFEPSVGVVATLELSPILSSSCLTLAPTPPPLVLSALPCALQRNASALGRSLLPSRMHLSSRLHKANVSSLVSVPVLSRTFASHSHPRLSQLIVKEPLPCLNGQFDEHDPTLDMDFLLLATHALCKDPADKSPELTTNKTHLLISALQSESVTNKERALGAVARCELKTLPTCLFFTLLGRNNLISLMVHWHVW
jgi:hypothetical protein